MPPRARIHARTALTFALQVVFTNTSRLVLFYERVLQLARM